MKKRLAGFSKGLVNSGGLPAVCEEGLSAVFFTRQLFGGVAGLTPITVDEKCPMSRADPSYLILCEIREVHK